MQEIKETSLGQTSAVQKMTFRHQRKQHTRCIAFEEILYGLLSKTTFALADRTFADVNKIKASECPLSRTTLADVKAILNWAKHSVHEQLCLLEMFKLAVWFLIDVFDLGEQLCLRPMGRRSDVRNVGRAGYGSKLLIGWTLSWRRRRNKKEARL